MASYPVRARALERLEWETVLGSALVIPTPPGHLHPSCALALLGVTQARNTTWTKLRRGGEKSFSVLSKASRSSVLVSRRGPKITATVEAILVMELPSVGAAGLILVRRLHRPNRRESWSRPQVVRRANSIAMGASEKSRTGVADYRSGSGAPSPFTHLLPLLESNMLRI